MTQQNLLASSNRILIISKDKRDKLFEGVRGDVARFTRVCVCCIYRDCLSWNCVRHPRKLSNIIFEGKKRLVCICSHVGWICNIVSKFLRLWSTSVKLFVSSTRTCPRLCSWAWNSFLVSPKRHSSNCRLDRSIVQMERDRLKSCFNTIPRFQRYLSPMEREFFIWDCNLINLFTWFVLRVWIEKKTNKKRTKTRRMGDD